MHGIRELVLKCKLGQHVVAPIYYGVSPYWGGQQDSILKAGWFDQPVQDRTKFGVTFPTAPEILRHAFCVPTSFALCRRDPPKDDIDLLEHARVHPESLVGRILASRVGAEELSAPVVAGDGLAMAAPQQPPRLHQLQWRLQPPDGCGDVCGSAVKGKAAVSEEVYRAAVAAEQLIVMTAEAWEAFDRGLGSTLYSVHGEGKKARGRSSGSKLPPVDWHKSDYRSDLLVQKGFKKVAADKPAIVVVEQPVAEGATWFEVKFVYSPGAASEVEGEARNAMLALSHSRFKEAEGGTATRRGPRDPLGESAEITERGSKTFVRRSLSTVAPPLFLFLLLPAPPSLTDPAPHTHSCNSTFFSPTHSFPPSLFSGGADAQLGRSRSTCAGREGEGAWSCTQVGRPVWTWWEERPEAPRGDQPRKPSRAGSGEPRA